MYNFIDTNEASGVNVLPSEAFQINGEFIENAIPGYRTLSVSGREALSPELATYETGIRDGSTLKSKRYPARVITVKYQIIAENNGAFREKYNQLASILDVEDAEIIFNDEADKYFIGTPSVIGEVEPGRNAVVGEFEILCVDPFKYSVEEYEVKPTITEVTDEEGNILTAKIFVVEYGGTYKSYPTLETAFYSENETSEDGEEDEELTGDGDCGFVAFINEDGKIIQLGDPDEDAGEDLPKSQTLVNQSFKESSSWGTATKKNWKQNTGHTRLDTILQMGTLKTYKSPMTISGSEYYLKANDYVGGDGVMGLGSKWHGPTITRNIPADKAGEEGASHFTLTYSQKMAIGSNDSEGQKQRGRFEVLLVYNDGETRKIVAGVMIKKGSTGKKGKLYLYVNGKNVYTKEISLAYHNKYFGNNRAANKKEKITAIKTVKTSTIEKVGNKVSFNIAGIKKTFTVSDDDFAEMQAHEITFAFASYGTKYTPLTYNGLYSAKLVKHKCETWRDVPNKFSADDVLIAECRTGKILLNDTEEPECGALGNDWEDFYLKPGVNQIGVAYSDWVEDAEAPEFKMRYREVFL